MMPITFIILGEPCSMKNSRRILRNRKTGKPFSAKSTEAVAYLLSARSQIPRQSPLIDIPVSVTATLFYTDRRRDLDFELGFDAMQGRIYVNDRCVTEKHLFRKIDKLNPRAVVTVEQI